MNSLYCLMNCLKEWLHVKGLSLISQMYGMSRCKQNGREAYSWYVLGGIYIPQHTLIFSISNITWVSSLYNLSLQVTKIVMSLLWCPAMDYSLISSMLPWQPLFEPKKGCLNNKAPGQYNIMYNLPWVHLGKL